jgi:hypothetical protein
MFLSISALCEPERGVAKRKTGRGEEAKKRLMNE